METINSLDEPIFSQTEMQDLVSSLHDYGTEVVVQADHTIVDYGEISTSMDLLTSDMGLIHIVVSNDLKADNVQKILTGSNSDHDGISCSIKIK